MRTGTLTVTPLARKTGALPRSCYLSSGSRSPSSVSMHSACDSTCTEHLYEKRMSEQCGAAGTNASVPEGRSCSIWRLWVVRLAAPRDGIEPSSLVLIPRAQSGPAFGSPGWNRTIVASPDSKSGGPCQQTNRGTLRSRGAPARVVDPDRVVASIRR